MFELVKVTFLFYGHDVFCFYFILTFKRILLTCSARSARYVVGLVIFNQVPSAELN